MKNSYKTEIILKIAALIIAVILWLNISFSKNYEMIKEIPVIVDSLNDSLVFDKPLNKTIKLRLYGKGKDLFSNLFNDEFYYLFKIQEDALYKKQIHEFSVDNLKGFHQSSEIEASIIGAKSVEYYLTKKITKKIPVQSNVLIETEKSFILCDNIQLIPDKVSITGPDILVNKIKEINTDTLKLLEISKNIEIDVKLIIGEEYKGLHINPDYITIKAEVSEIHTIDFNQIPVELSFYKKYQPKEGEEIILENSYCNIILSGPDFYLDSLKEDDIEAFIQIKTPLSAENMLKINVRLKKLEEKIKVVHINPDSISVKLIKKN